MMVELSQPKVPKLRFREFVGEWAQERLGAIANIYDGTHQTPAYVDQGVPFYSVEQVTSNDFEVTKFISEEVFEKECLRVRLEQGDILMTRIGDIGTVRYLNWDVRASFYVSLALIKVKTRASALFVATAIRTSQFQRELWHRTIHVAFPKKINLGEIGECRMWMPALPEQKKIAAVLRAVDEKLTGLRREHVLFAEYKRGVIQELFSQKLRFKREDGGDFPEWEEKPLRDVLSEHGLKSTGAEPVFSVSVHKGLVDQIEHLGRSFSAKETDHYNRVLPGDIVYTRSPTGEFPLGIVKQSKNSSDVIVSPLYGVFTPETNWLGAILDAYFASNVNVNNYLKPIVQKGAKNTINVTNAGFLRGALRVPVHPDEQRKIADFLTALDVKIETIALQIAQTETFMKGLLQQMFV